MKFLCVILLSFSAKCFAQYPFEKFPTLKWKEIPFKITRNSDLTEIGIADYLNYKIKLTQGKSSVGSNICLYFKNHLLKKIDTLFYITNDELKHTKLDIADINGDDLSDFRIIYINTSAGGIGSSEFENIYFFNKGNNEVSAISFEGFHDDGLGQEFDFNKDRNYKIVGLNLVIYGSSRYWLYDIYRYKNGKLINVSKQYGYPIAYDFLSDDKRPTRKIPQKELKHLSLALPENYRVN